MEAGVDVLIEKPVASTIAEAAEIGSLAQKHNRVVQVGHLERFNPAVRATLPLITKPMFFEVHRLSQFTPRSLDIDVVLEQTEVHPGGIVVVELPQLFILNELSDLLDCPREEERVVHHDGEVVLLRQIDEFLGLARRGRERFLNKNVLAVVERLLGELEVRPDGSNHRDRINLGRMQQLGAVCGHVDARIGPLGPLQAGYVLVTDRYHLHRTQAVKISYYIRTPIAVTNNSETDHTIDLSPYQAPSRLRTARGVCKRIFRSSQSDHSLA